MLPDPAAVSTTISTTGTIDAADPVEVAGRLRYSVLRMARLLRQQDGTGPSPALISALAVIEREGPLTLGELAGQERVAPPTITKVVDTLVEHGFVERVKDDTDGRVRRVRTTARGRRQLDATRTRRTAWLATQLRDLPPDDVTRIADALDVLEQLTKPPTRDPS